MALIMAKTESGIVEGVPAGNQAVSVFKGIPFAAPPVGKLRWKAPQPAEPWEGVRKTQTFSAIPIQNRVTKGSFYQKEFYPVELPRSEDCLYLNIWTPAESTDEKLPVAIWIFGGGYSQGYANKMEFDGEAFAKRGCILVTINYRLGILGYLAHPDLSAENDMGISGNYGSLDQVAAIKWVYRNIENFGGDPEKITVFGQSAGASSTMLMCSSPLTEGYIRRAIIQSVGGLSLMYYKSEKTLAEAEENGIKAFELLGINSLEEAREMEPVELYAKASALRVNGISFEPNIDGYLLNDGIVTSIMKNSHQKIDYMIGATANEGWNNPVNDDPAALKAYANNMFGEEAEDYIKAVTNGDDANVYMAVKDRSGAEKNAAAFAWNELELQRGGNTAYQYLFSKPAPGDDSGAFHSSEHMYVFQTLARHNWRPYDGTDFNLSNIMCAYWTNFVKTGDPNGDGLPKWKKYNGSAEKVLELGKKVQMIDTPPIVGLEFIRDYMLEEAKKFN